MDSDPFRERYRPDAGDPAPEPEAPRPRPTVYEAGRRRISAVNRWVLAGSVVLMGAFAGIASQAFHGKTRNAAAATPPPPAVESDPGQAPPAGDPSLQPPDEAPQPSQQDPGAASGGS